MNHGQLLCRMASVSTICAAGVFVACGEPTAVGEPASFTAHITGSATGSLTGTATAGTSADWARESVVQVTLPNGGTFSGIVLAAAGGANTISFVRSGTDLPPGTFRLGRGATGGFSAGYVIRRPDALQLFVADSGTLTIAERGGRVSGTFTVYVNAYDVLSIPTQDMIGKPITKLDSGSSPMTISGSFSAGKR